MDTLRLEIRKGSGKIPESIYDLGGTEGLFGHPIEISEVHVKGALEFILAGLVLYLPIKILGKIFNKLIDDLADDIYDKFKEAIKEFLLVNNNNCEISIHSNIDKNSIPIKVIIRAPDLNHKNLDKYFNNFPINIQDFLVTLELPGNNGGILYIDYLLKCNDTSITFHSSDFEKLYGYSIRESKWFDLSKYEYKCSYCKKVEIGQYYDNLRYNVCPYCGKLYLETIQYIREYFRIIRLSPLLQHCQDVLLSGNLDMAVREAIIVFEDIVKKVSKLKDLNGKDLISKAFSFEYDKLDGRVLIPPLIQLNSLDSLSKRNEQEGAKLMLMGFMQGIRNIYMHGKGAGNLYYSIQIITLIDIYLNAVVGKDKSIASYAEQ